MLTDNFTLVLSGAVIGWLIGYWPTYKELIRQNTEK